ncbi:MAG: hypothetical protein SWX82_25350 [Cyanobacteriota bacterium]|nr:hypothetical protein [Cyanobacteriota bacterium]
MKNWKYFRLIIGSGFFLILCPFIVTEKIHIHSKAIAQQTTKYSDRLTQENLEIEAQQLDEKATQQLCIVNFLKKYVNRGSSSIDFYFQKV